MIDLIKTVDFSSWQSLYKKEWYLKFKRLSKIIIKLQNNPFALDFKPKQISYLNEKKKKKKGKLKLIPKSKNRQDGSSFFRDFSFSFC